MVASLQDLRLRQQQARETVRTSPPEDAPSSTIGNSGQTGQLLVHASEFAQATRRSPLEDPAGATKIELQSLRLFVNDPLPIPPKTQKELEEERFMWFPNAVDIPHLDRKKRKLTRRGV